MKCKDCSRCVKGYFSDKKEEYVCVGTKEPFIIGGDLNVNCSVYPERKVDVEREEIVNELVIRASRKSNLSSTKLLKTINDCGLLGVYNLGMIDMLNYLLESDAFEM